jgi:replicative DNA helicase
LNLASALIYRVLELEDFDTWTNVRKHYLPSEHHTLFDVIEKHIEQFHKLPTMEQLRLGVRDAATLDKVYALESIETEAEPDYLLEAIKSEYAQREALFQMDKWVDASMAFETAEEVVRHIQQIGLDLETKVELTPASETMQKISLFDTEEEMDARITLGFNEEFDSRFNFRPTDYIMMGGKRGAGKSLTGSNIARHVITAQKKKVLYFSVEMQSREVLQRDAAIATGIPFYKIRNRDMSTDEWLLLAQWWSERYVDGEDAYESYVKHRDFDKFHTLVSRHELVDAHLDIIYNPQLTLGQLNAEVDKRLAKGEEIGLIVADYVQKIKRSNVASHSINDLDWKEQMFVSNGLKTGAQVWSVPVYSPYQIDAQGEARIAKGILDSCDAAFTLEAHKGDTPGITFKTTKMRGASDEEEFTSAMNWGNLRIGPKSIEKPETGEKKSSKFGVGAVQAKSGEIYD